MSLTKLYYKYLWENFYSNFNLKKKYFKKFKISLTIKYVKNKVI